MKRNLFSTAAAAMLSGLGGFGMSRQGIHRFTSESRTGRSMISKKYRNRSKYMPHQGAKERARAARCYESEFLNQKFVDYWLGHPMNVILSSDQCHARSTPTLCQMSKRQYEACSSKVA